jgi:hypothetical protein
MTAVSEEKPATREASDNDSISLTFTDVTGMRELSAEFPRATPVRSVTQTVVNRLSLSSNTPWQLRSDRTSAYLADDASIGSQIGPSERVTVTPKAHLG